MPSITIWNRIEPRCRDLDLKRSLEARVHDPLWLLARQWQIGEFEGRDAGSPVTVEAVASVASLDRYSVAGQTAQPFDSRQPVETLVEREAIRPTGASSDIRQATEAGLYFMRLLAAAQVPADIVAAYLGQYRLSAPSPAGADAQTISSIVAGRVIDGIRLHADLLSAGNNLPSSPPIPQAQRDVVFKVTRDWLNWYGSLFSEPAQAEGWSPDRMEYGFAMGTAGDTGSYTAQEYDGGTVDWHTFDRSSKTLTDGTMQTSSVSRTAIATPITFRGMPARRFWEMEDSGTNLAMLSAAAEDLGRLLLREFAFVYGNDWFQFPLAIPVGSQVIIGSLSIGDTFGIKTTIPHYSAVDGVAGKWSMFSISPDSSTPSDTTPVQPVLQSLVLAPGAVAPLDGPAIEDVLLLRDELANMGWGIERIVPGVSGQPVDRTLLWRTVAAQTTPPAVNAVLRYHLGSDVPDYWIPFLPVVVDDGGPLRLRRGRLPTAQSGPLGRMLNYPNLTMFLEELPREGVHLERRYRYARGLNGSTLLWVGRHRSVGRGEGRSGLKFDFVD